MSTEAQLEFEVISPGLSSDPSCSVSEPPPTLARWPLVLVREGFAGKADRSTRAADTVTRRTPAVASELAAASALPGAGAADTSDGDAETLTSTSKTSKTLPGSSCCNGMML